MKRRIRRAGLCALTFALAAGCAGTPAQCKSPWNRVESFREGGVSVPAGWHVLITAGPRFALYSPDPALAAFVVIVRPDGLHDSLASAAQRVARGIGGPAGFVMTTRQDASLYGEVQTSARRVVAGCAVDSKRGFMALVVARLVDVESVDTNAYLRAGGDKTLCTIARSVRSHD